MSTVALNPNVTISGTGSCIPDRVIDNDTLAGMVSGYDASRSGPFGAWVDQVTHIHERRFCAPEVRSSDLGLIASQRALEAAGIEARDLGMIIYASFTPSQMIPGDHCMMAEDLGAQGVPVYQLVAACAGSIYSLSMAYSLVASGMYEHVLVVGTETISKILNFTDPITSIIFGDGAGAAVVSRRDGSEGGGMYPPYMTFKYSPRNIKLANSNIPVDVAVFPDREITPGVPLVEQALVEMESGPNVLRTAVTEMSGATATALGFERRDLRRGTPELMGLLENARIVPHQANGRILDGLADKLKVSRQQVTRTIYKFGNISAASNMLALDFAFRNGNLARVLDDDGHVLDVVEQPEHKIKKGELVLLPSIGGGYLIGCIGFIAEPHLTELAPVQDPATAVRAS
jgi:3-oxoacyl-[acyl-carrier-protein] synthase-3